MMLLKINAQLHWHQDDTFVLTFYDGRTAAISKRFKPGDYSAALTWADGEAK